ncbi:hypothetical protein J6590_013501 [Homalodisca vitripennis]|nr:hypothetical protein J6590_013501 [Homalodisca vitripennis]
MTIVFVQLLVLVSKIALRSQHQFRTSQTGRKTDVIAISDTVRHTSGTLNDLSPSPEEEVIVINSSGISVDFGAEEDGPDMSHVSVVKVGDESASGHDSLWNSLDGMEADSLMIVGSGGSTSIVVEGTTTEITDVDRVSPHPPHSPKVNGQPAIPASDSDEVYIIVNKTTNLQKKGETEMERPGGETSETGSLHTPPSLASTRTLDRSDAESVATTVSQDSNKENTRPDQDLVLRRNTEYNRQEGVRHSRTKEELELHNLKKKTRKRTRKFEIDGVVVTTTTSKVIYADEESGRGYDDQIFRKQELREFKMLQKQEQKQFQDLSMKAHLAKDQQDKRFDQEKVTLLKTYEADLELLSRQQRQQVEKAETQQEADLRVASKRIRAEQERELKEFRESLKTEMRLLRQEIDLMPKDKRKSVFRGRKEKLEVEHEERVSLQNFH